MPSVVSVSLKYGRHTPALSRSVTASIAPTVIDGAAAVPPTVRRPLQMSCPHVAPRRCRRLLSSSRSAPAFFAGPSSNGGSVAPIDGAGVKETGIGECSYSERTFRSQRLSGESQRKVGRSEPSPTAAVHATCPVTCCASSASSVARSAASSKCASLRRSTKR